MGEAQALYADAAHGEGARWLVLAETPAAALQREPFNPFEGEAGKLLDNMLRAARLHKAGVVLIAPMARGAAAGAGASLPEALHALVAGAQPDVVLVMGRLAAQALLQSSEPFGKLRGQVHGLHGAKTVLTYDATYLLRNPADKAKAWDDLCLAMGLVLPPGSIET
jgi:uracil-DNA glycosylase family 4